MNPERWQQVKTVLGAALECPGPVERRAYAADACADDTDLQREVEALLDQTTSSLGTYADDAGPTSAALPAGTSAWAVPGRRVGVYALQRELGRGGMGAVWLATRADGRFEQTVAIKLLKRGTDTEEILRRFHAERQILARLEHPNIARLLDGGETEEGLPFLVMEHVDGVRITDFVRARHLPVPASVGLFRKVCAAVEFAHQNLVVHRDLKPGNILVTPAGEPKLLDFGIAKLLDAASDAEVTQADLRRLTPAYASPEQVRGAAITTVSDVYSLGALLYELLANRPAHRFGAPCPPASEVLRVVVDETPERPGLAATDADARRRLRGDLDTVILRALAKDPARRYASVRALSEDLRRWQEGWPVRARADTWRYRTGKFVSRNKLLVAGAVVVVLSVFGGGATAVWQARRANRRFQEVRELAKSVLFEMEDAIATLPGSTAVRRLLVTRALQYLDNLARDAGGDRGLQLELTAAYLKVGDVQGRPNFPNLGDTSGALASYRRAAALAERLPGTDDAPAAIRADAWDALGNLLAAMGQPAEAERLVRQALAVRERLASRHPTGTDRQRAVAASLVSLGDTILAGAVAVWDQDSRYPEALGCYRRALTLREAARTARPSDPGLTRELAIVHYRLGNVMFVLGTRAPGDRAQLQGSLGHHRISVSLREENLAAHPNGAQTRRDLADGLTMKSVVQARLGDAAGALVDCRRAVALLESLAAADPENVWARQDLAYAHFCASLSEQSLGDLAGSLASADRGIQLYEALAAADPTNLMLFSHLDHLLRLRTELCGAMGDAPGRRDSARRWAATDERLLAATPGDPALTADLASARAVLAESDGGGKP